MTPSKVPFSSRSTNDVNSGSGLSERRLIAVVAAIQFVNVLEFMMVMPLGPDFARDLGIPAARLGWIGGSYTAAAAIAGLAAARFLDRFDRRAALATTLVGLAVATVLGGFANGLGSLMAARMLSGLFGGPATSLSLSILADRIPAERRGQAFGVVMGAFSVASVVGVPAALEAARLSTWRLPFFAVSVLCVAAFVMVRWLLPPLRDHLESHRGVDSAALATRLWHRPVVLLSWTLTATLMMSGFLVIPFLSPYFQFNRDFPRDRLGLLYMVGGAVSFVALRWAGGLSDRRGAVWVGTIGSALLVAVLLAGFVLPLELPVALIFVWMMLALSFRNLPHTTLTSKVPRPWERAQFMSIQSSVQHLGAAAGAFAASEILYAPTPESPLEGMPLVGGISMALGILVPVLMYAVERRVQASATAALPPIPET